MQRPKHSCAHTHTHRNTFTQTYSLALCLSLGVQVRDGEVEVALSSAAGPLHDGAEYPSDYYASEQYRAIMARARPPASAAAVGAAMDAI
jgi:hypothetical protein